MLQISRRAFASFGGVAMASAILAMQVGHIAQADEAEVAPGHSVQIGRAVFCLPDVWEIEGESLNTEFAKAYIKDELGNRLGVAELSVVNGIQSSGSPSDNLEGLMRELRPSEGELLAMWASSDIGQNGPTMLRMSVVCRDGQGEVNPGLVYGVIPDGSAFYSFTVYANPSAVGMVEEAAEDIWNGVDWDALSIDVSDLEAFKADALARGIARNRENPYYNEYWEVVDFDCTLDTSNLETPYPTHMRYKFATPEGIEAWEDEIFKEALYQTSEMLGEIWCMRRQDSEGASYYRSTAEVEGYGVVDIAFYPDYSNCWYIASTGIAINMDADGVWRQFGDVSAEPWTPYFFG